jgi:hypothetical protein
VTIPESEGNRNALLALHFQECDPRQAAATRKHVEGCAACRDYLAALASIEGTLRAWPDERPPARLVDRVLVHAVPPARQAPVRRPAPSAMPLLSLLPVMAALLAALRHLASWLPTLAVWPQLDTSPVLELVIPFGVAAFVLLVMGGLSTLAIAPALVLETAGGVRRGARLQE